LAQIWKKTPENQGFFHQFVTAADAKIPLSVVQVKREPQYVVFSSPYGGPSSATPAVGCAKRESPRPMRVSALNFQKSRRLIQVPMSGQGPVGDSRTSASHP
jgi:hypothetical protein